MKRMSCIALLLSVLLAGNTFALTTYQMDAPTALLMRPVSVSSGDIFNLKYIGSNPGGSSEQVAGSSITYGDTMLFDVGFTGDLEDGNGDLSAIVKIGLTQSQIATNITGSYDSFLISVSNDNNQDWSYRSYIDDGTNPILYSSWVSLVPDTTKDLWIFMPTTDFSTLSGLGFEIQWIYPSGGSNTDTFHTSVVPVPGALLLGLIGLGSLRVKFRR